MSGIKDKKKTIRKWLISTVAAMCFITLGAAVGCTKKPSYYSLTFSLPRGVELNCYHEDGTRLESGTEIRKGYEVKFSLSVSEYCTGEAKVYANADLVQADADGNYSFVMKKKTIVAVDGVEYIPHYTVKFVRGTNNRVWYEYGGEEVEDNYEVGFVAGDTVRFGVRTSVYYKDAYEVLANTEVLEAKDGYYSFACTEDTNITVHGLSNEEDFYAKEVNAYNDLLTESNAISAMIDKLDPETQADEIARLGQQLAQKKSEAQEKQRYILNDLGKSWEHPYVLKNAIDLYALASYVNDDYYADMGFQYAYYSLEEDIDLKGEQLFVIGDGFNSSAYFCGHFNGNGHKISNFTLSDVLVDQEEFVNIYLASVGMFGFASASDYGAAEIYALHLENYRADINAAPHVSSDGSNMLFFGGLVGRSLGAQIAGCSASGTVNIRGNINVSVFVGGLVGYCQSVYAQTASFYSALRSCSTNTFVNATGFVLAAGGIVGYLDSGDERVNANVVNAYATGNVNGALNAGGIVGYIGPYSSVQNAYSTGSVHANSVFNYRDKDTELYCYANAGGIAGYADYNSAVCDSYSTATLSASSLEGMKYQKTGCIFANTTVKGAPNADSVPAVAVGCGDRETATALWSSGDWILGETPVFQEGVGANVFTVRIRRGDNDELQTSLSVDSVYMPVSYWYAYAENKLEEYLTSGGLRSFGYYFDADCAVKVPCGYVPMHDVDLYVRYADYAQVAGTYYFARADRVSIELTEDGTLFYRAGALEYRSNYAYDGAQVMLYKTLLCYLSDAYSGTAEYKAYAAVRRADGSLFITDPDYFPAGSELTGRGKYTPFAYGAYFNDSGRYTFYENGGGALQEGNGYLGFTFTAIDGALTLRFTDGTTVAGVLNASGEVVRLGNAAVKKSDAFYGVWKKSLTTIEEYEFDGRSADGAGVWIYRVNGAAVASGSYTVNGNLLSNTASGDFVSAELKDGLLYVTDSHGERVYGREEGFLGVWRFANGTEPIALTLFGCNADGVGEGTIRYEAQENAENAPVRYEVTTLSDVQAVVVYADGVQIASLLYDKTQGTLSGDVYSNLYQAVRSDAVFYLQDDFNGEWTGTGAFERVSFNGRGLYDLRATDSHMLVRGYVTVNGKRVQYRYDAATAEATFTLDGTQYTARLAGDCVTISDGNGTVVTLTK